MSPLYIISIVEFLCFFPLFSHSLFLSDIGSNLINRSIVRGQTSMLRGQTASRHLRTIPIIHHSRQVTTTTALLSSKRDGESDGEEGNDGGDILSSLSSFPPSVIAGVVLMILPFLASIFSPTPAGVDGEVTSESIERMQRRQRQGLLGVVASGALVLDGLAGMNTANFQRDQEEREKVKASKIRIKTATEDADTSPPRPLSSSSSSPSPSPSSSSKSSTAESPPTMTLLEHKKTTASSFLTPGASFTLRGAVSNTPASFAALLSSSGADDGLYSVLGVTEGVFLPPAGSVVEVVESSMLGAQAKVARGEGTGDRGGELYLPVLGNSPGGKAEFWGWFGGKGKSLVVLGKGRAVEANKEKGGVVILVVAGENEKDFSPRDIAWLKGLLGGSDLL